MRSRLKAKNPEHEKAGLTNRHYGMKNELLSATTPEGNKITNDPMRSPSTPAPTPAPVPSSGSVAGQVATPPSTPDTAEPKKDRFTDPAANGPRYGESGLDKFYANNPHLQRGVPSSQTPNPRSPNSSPMRKPKMKKKMGKPEMSSDEKAFAKQDAYDKKNGYASIHDPL